VSKAIGIAQVKRASVLRVLPYALVPILYGLGLATIQGYSSKLSIISLLVLASMLGIAAVGQTLVVIVAGIDLSIPFVLGMADVVVTQEYAAGWPFWACVLVVILAGAAVGAANGYLSRLLNVYPLVITLATGSIVFGGVLAWSNGMTGGLVPGYLVSAVSVIGRTGPIAVPPVIVGWLVIAVVIIVVQRRTAFGRRLYATGDNPKAADLAHLNVTRVWVITFALSGAFAAMSGVLFAGFTTLSDATVGEPYLFQTIAAVVIGGTSLLGGRGGYGRTILGVLTLTQLTTLLVGAGLSSDMQESLLGLLIVLLLAMYGREPALESRI
jgi:ribose transport system permease protein